MNIYRLATALFFFSASLQALACPSIGGIPDFNCDGKLQVVVMGDSLAYGIGDTAHGNRGGYVLRAAAAMHALTFINLGQPGLFSQQLVGQLTDTFTKGKTPQMKTALRGADIVFLDLGRNDRWLFGEPIATYRNLKRAATLIKREVTKLEGVPPLVVTTVLMLPNRGAQAPWVSVLNDYILRGSTAGDPADLRFDQVSKYLLSADRIHPTSVGYVQMAKVFVTYIKKTLPPRMRTLRPDTDADGLPDILETEKYGTSPLLADTDSDGHSDGEEVLVLGTDPLVP